MLPDTDADGADRLLIEILDRLRNIPVRREITFSAGLTPWVEGETTDELLHRADTALYQAKRNGRNRVERA